MISSKKKSPAAVSSKPITAPATIINVKLLLASSMFPFPIFFATTALPPVASIVPRPTIRLMTGQTILMDDRAFVSTNRATKIVSTIVYNPINSIITMLGKANRIRDRALKLSANGFFCVSVIPCFLLVLWKKHETLCRVAIFHKQFPFCKSKTAVFFPPARICLIACMVCRQCNLFPTKQFLCQLIKEQLCNAEMPILWMDSQKVYAACALRNPSRQ